MVALLFIITAVTTTGKAAWGARRDAARAIKCTAMDAWRSTRYLAPLSHGYLHDGEATR